jgi:hypothetical protein
MSRTRNLLLNSSGVSALEFALISPVLIGIILGTFQMGRLYFANSDLNNALAAGARQATIFPTPNDNEILDTVEASLTGLNPNLLGNSIRRFEGANGVNYADMRVSYRLPIDMVFYRTAVTLVAERRVFTYAPPAPAGDLDAADTCARACTCARPCAYARTYADADA